MTCDTLAIFKYNAFNEHFWSYYYYRFTVHIELESLNLKLNINYW